MEAAVRISIFAILSRFLSNQNNLQINIQLKAEEIFRIQYPSIDFKGDHISP